MIFKAAEFREVWPAFHKNEERTVLELPQVQQMASSNVQLVVTALVVVNNTSGFS